MRGWAITLLVLALIAGFSGYSNRQAAAFRANLEDEIHQRCVENKKNRRQLRKIVFRTRDVGKPGTPGYDYYRTRPAEKRAALARVNQAIANLPPITCEGG